MSTVHNKLNLNSGNVAENIKIYCQLENRNGKNIKSNGLLGNEYVFALIKFSKKINDDEIYLVEYPIGFYTYTFSRKSKIFSNKIQEKIIPNYMINNSYFKNST
tara:strand:- start:1825 stop:2136 length:312 start_codon:yes stop_codon:yes gene_type:complete